MKFLHKHGILVFVVIIVCIIAMVYYLYSGTSHLKQQQLFEEIKEHQQGAMIQ
ncbi:hypothetical protein XF24_00550 [candidate division SR1 bacterium Aalborg_AAW-1]|nr:hypothetical protein XF24_00550 [candidate division SR1 bacterium Aalborg_AAW-1]